MLSFGFEQMMICLLWYRCHYQYQHYIHLSTCIYLLLFHLLITLTILSPSSFQHPLITLSFLDHSRLALYSVSLTSTSCLDTHSFSSLSTRSSRPVSGSPKSPSSTTCSQTYYRQSPRTWKAAYHQIPSFPHSQSVVYLLALPSRLITRTYVHVRLSDNIYNHCFPSSSTCFKSIFQNYHAHFSWQLAAVLFLSTYFSLRFLVLF